MDSPRYCSWAPDRLLRDPSVRRMNAEAFGAYCSLLMEIWLDPTGSIDADPDNLALLARLTKSGWEKHKKVILSLLELDQDRYYSSIIEEARLRIAKKSEIGRAAVEERERRKKQKLGYVEPKVGSNDDQTIIERSSKEKEKEKEKENLPSSPSGHKKAARVSQKAIDKGDERNEHSWMEFDAVYPRPNNGRKIERAQARLIWDVLHDAGEDTQKIIDGARNYANWVTATNKFAYVAMMTTWLNQRRWEESYLIAPDSEEAARIQAEAKLKAEKEAKFTMDKFKTEYETLRFNIANEHLSDPEFQVWFANDLRNKIERRRSMGSEFGARVLEKITEDPEALKKEQISRWLERNNNVLPTFEQFIESKRGGAL